MNLRNRLLTIFLPLLIIPSLLLALLQMVLVRNYLFTTQKDVLAEQSQQFIQEFLTEYDEFSRLGIEDIPFYQYRLFQILQDQFYGNSTGYSGFAVVRFDGTLLRPFSLNGKSELSAAFEELLRNNAGGETFVFDGSYIGFPSRKVVGASYVHEPSAWTILMYESPQLLFQTVNQGALVAMLVILLNFLFVGAAIILAAKSISEPIVKLTQAVVNFGRGEANQVVDISQSGEVGILAGEFSKMMARIDSFTRELEDNIAERTRELERSLVELKIAQDQLIESEKLASLGSVVAGFAHEINTPIGVSLTAVTSVEDAVIRAENMLDSPQVSKSQLSSLLKQVKEASRISVENLFRADEMIQRFKQVAADQYFEDCRELSLSDFFENIRDTLLTILKPARVQLEISIREQYSVVTYPGVLWQVFSNLARNSLVHGFQSAPSKEDGAVNRVGIFCREEGKGVRLIFCDNGPGVPVEHASQIFEPFFTTRRNLGSTGLGLHLVYNLVAKKLEGKFGYLPSEYRECLPDAFRHSGACFFLDLPISLHIEEKPLLSY